MITVRGTIGVEEPASNQQLVDFALAYSEFVARVEQVTRSHWMPVAAVPGP